MPLRCRRYRKQGLGEGSKIIPLGYNSRETGEWLDALRLDSWGVIWQVVFILLLIILRYLKLAEKVLFPKLP